MLAGCFIKLIIPFFTFTNKEKSSKKESSNNSNSIKKISKANLKVSSLSLVLWQGHGSTISQLS
jgi:hypothetical protein